MVAGTLHVCSFEARVLFDLESIYLYVFTYFTSRFGKQLVMVNHPFWVGILIGEPFMVQLIFPLCLVSTNGVDTLANLMLLEMMDFDVILGMD